MTSIFKKLTLSVLTGLTVLLSVLPQAALAHGERATEPYIRTRTIHWYDVTWSTDKLSVNETVTMEGKFRLLTDWPDAVSQPHMTFLSNGSPGAVMTRVESYINDMPAQQSTKNLEIGRDYRFKLVMKGRVPGHWHLHPVLNIHGAGAIVGPGEYVTVGGNAADYKEPVTTMHGNKIADLQSFGVTRVQKWQAGYALIAAIWIVWWIRRPLLISRWRALQNGREDLLVTRADDKAAAILLVAVLAVVIVGFRATTKEFPQLVPLQGGSLYTPPLPEAPNAVTVKLKRAEYDVPGRSMRLSVELTNHSDQPLYVGEFTTASLRFVNKKVPAAVAGAAVYPRDLVPGNGLQVDSDAPLAPGETRSMVIDATDAAWELERLVSFLSNVDSRTGGLIFFFDPKGNRYISEVYGPILPVFKKTI